MRAPVPLFVGLAILAIPLAAGGAPDFDAYEVAGHHLILGPVSGYLYVQESSLAELWLSGPLILGYYARFSFTCDTYGDSIVVVEECGGSHGSRFAGAYFVDEGGAALGPASGAGEMFGFRLVAHGHT